MKPRQKTVLESGLSDLIPADTSVLARFRNVSACSQQTNKQQ